MFSRFQEVVPLKASNVLGSDKKTTSIKWNSLIRNALNKKSYSPCNKNNSFSKNQQRSIQPVFRCLISKQMVGIMISVWIRSDLHPFFRNPHVSCVGCGIMGCLGNKVMIYINSLKSHIQSTNQSFKHI